MPPSSAALGISLPISGLISCPPPAAWYAMASAFGLWLFTYVCVPTTFELQSGTWVMAGAIGGMSRLQWKYYKKYV